MEQKRLSDFWMQQKRNLFALISTFFNMINDLNQMQAAVDFLMKVSSFHGITFIAIDSSTGMELADKQLLIVQ